MTHAGRVFNTALMNHDRSESSTASTHDWRPQLLVVGLMLVWLVLAGRLVHLQWVSQDELTERASRQRLHEEIIPARPGEILDRQGRLLATTVTSQSLYVVPSRISNPWQTAMMLSDALDLDADRLFERLTEQRDRHFLWVQRRLTEDEAERIRVLGLPERTWGFREEFLRRYPQGTLAAHVLGIRDIDGRGRGGLEQSLDGVLRGRDGRRVLVRDARGHVVAVRDELAQAPRHGQTVSLTIDAVIQLYTERELDRLMRQWEPRSAAVIVMDPQTAEVLAMASRPTFDPNAPGGAPPEAWKNTAVAAVYEPGSTFKPFIVGWALEKGFLEPGEQLDCEQGAYRMGRRVLHDHHPYGLLSVSDILVKSSNIGMAKIGERMGNPELHAAAAAFGFGARTGIELPGELAGTLHPLRQWTGYSTGSIPMGQELTATPLQIITAHAALAGGGVYRSPRLVMRQSDAPTILGGRPSPGRTEPAIVSTLLREETADWLVQEAMRGAVERGTGRRAKLSDYAVFGKTGTAQKLDRETGTYSKSRHVSSFVCGAPADNPRVLVLVVADEPTLGHSDYGGEVAAPSAGRILHETLRHLRVPAKKLASRAESAIR